MSGQLEIKQSKENDQLILTFIGAINEDSDFSSLDQLNESSIVFDLDNITYLNSCGIREWIKFLEQINSQTKLTYRKCPQVIVEQMNIVKGFIRPGSQIESFYAPYYNEETDEEIKVLLSPKDVNELKAPVQKSNEGIILEFDDIEAQYFNFLKNI